MEIQLKHFWKHLLIETVGVIILSIGGAGIMRVGLGNSAYDAFSVSISLLSHIEVGTVATIINLFCVLIQMVLLRKKYKPLYLLQIFVSIVIGVVVNLFYYHIFDQIMPESYVLKMVWFVFLVLVDILGVSLVVASGMIGCGINLYGGGEEVLLAFFVHTFCSRCVFLYSCFYDLALVSYSSSFAGRNRDIDVIV